MNPRVTLTKKQIATDAGTQLLSLLVDIGQDGELTAEEIYRLRGWLENNRTVEFPGIQHLRAVVDEALRDEQLSDDERLDLLLELERVLPIHDRSAVTAARRDRAAQLRAEERAQRTVEARSGAYSDSDYAQSPAWHAHPATDAQKNYIRALGELNAAPQTKGEASTLIEALLARPKSPTPRQKMVLRFWGVDLPGASRTEISAWMNGFYADDEDRIFAWEEYKREIVDDGSQRDPDTIPLRVGHTYLERVKKRRRESGGQGLDWSPKIPAVVGWIALAAAIGAIVVVAWRCRGA